MVVPGTFLRVLYNNIHHHVAFARELEEKEKTTEQDQPAVRSAVAAAPPPAAAAAAAAAEVRFSMTCRFVDGQGKRGNVHIPAILSVAFPDVARLTVSFSCGVVYARGNRTPDSEKKQTYVYLVKQKNKKKMLVYIPGTHISPFALALEGSVNSNPSSREKLFLRTAKPRTARYLVRNQAVYSRVKRTPESEKKKTYVYLIKRKNKNKMLVYVPGTYISPFVLALEGVVNSNPSSRERLRKSETGPKQLRTWLTRSVLPHTGDQARSVE